MNIKDIIFIIIIISAAIYWIIHLPLVDDIKLPGSIIVKRFYKKYNIYEDVLVSINSIIYYYMWIAAEILYEYYNEEASSKFKVYRPFKDKDYTIKFYTNNKTYIVYLFSEDNTIHVSEGQGDKYLIIFKLINILLDFCNENNNVNYKLKESVYYLNYYWNYRKFANINYNGFASIYDIYY